LSSYHRNILTKLATVTYVVVPESGWGPSESSQSEQGGPDWAVEYAVVHELLRLIERGRHEHFADLMMCYLAKVTEPERMS
jgi:hypothetical protein